jgi:tubulin monoglycylase TTLL3/8
MSITTSKQVKLWLYKDCYLRFSSQEFSLDKLSADVHLTNHFVQKNYRNAKRDERLPVSNMWSLAEFLYFLKTIDKFDVWDEVIYPGMKRNIRTIVMASLDETEIAANTFQLFGADFMIESGSFKPILIEVNSSPDLRPTTHVTKKICAEVLEDLIKGEIEVSSRFSQF